MSKGEKNHNGKRGTPWRWWRNLSKKKKMAGGIIGAAVILLGGAGYTVFLAPLQDQEKWVYKEAPVEQGSIKLGVSESGSLEYGISSILYDLDLSVDEDSEEESEEEESEEEESEEEDQESQKYLKVEEVYVAVGERIQQNGKVMKFTDDSVSAVRKLLQNALINAQSELNAAESEYELSALEARTEYDTSKVSAGYASQVYKAGSSAVSDDINVMKIEVEQRTANISALEEKTAKAQETYQEALEAYEKAQEALEQTGKDNLYNYLSVKSSYNSAQTKYQSAKTALDQAKQDQEDNTLQIESLKEEIALSGKRSEIDKLDVNHSYQESKLNGENAQITYQAKLESLKEELQEAEETKQKAREQLDAFQDFVGEDGTVTTDGAGIVTQVGYQAGDTLTSEGTVVSYASGEDMTISVDVTQEDVVDLNVGDHADIVFAAYENDIYEGTILSIDTTATSEDSATVSYKVVIGVGGDTSRLYGGMTADITFVTGQKDDVLYISKKAILEENGKQYVYVKTASGGREMREVETGISNGTSIEIVSGLSSEDTIFIASRVSSQAEVEKTAEGEEAAGSGQLVFPDGGQMPDINEMMQNGNSLEQGNVIEIPEGGVPDMGGMRQEMEAAP